MKYNAKEAAKYLGVSERTLANWRAEKRGPQFYKPSEKLTYYFQDDLDAWIKSSAGDQVKAFVRAAANYDFLRKK